MNAQTKIEEDLPRWRLDDLYTGRDDPRIETDLIAFLRPEEKFDSLEIMTDQVMKDAARAREILDS